MDKLLPVMPNRDLVFQSQINSIDPFTGVHTQDAARWLTHAANILHVQGFVDSNELKHLISGFLDGEALDWFEDQKAALHDWHEFRTAFIQRFPSPPSIRNPFEYFQQLSHRRQGLKEPTVEYYTHVLKLCHQYNSHMSDIERVDHLKKGLRPSLLEKVLDRDPCTPDEFIEVVFKAESNQRIIQVQFDLNANNNHRDHQDIDDVGHTSPPVPPQPRYNTSPVQQQRSTDRPPHRSTDRPPPGSADRPPHRSTDRLPRRTTERDADIVCYTCGQPGHISPQCHLNWH